MSRNALKAKAKIAKKEKAEQQLQQKKRWIVSVCILLAVAALGFVLHMVIWQQNRGKAETYSYQGQTVQLFSDGSFTASLSHNVRKSGIYIKTTENNQVSVIFNVNGNMEVGRIINNALHIPREWDDGHGHGNVFPQTDS